jgi:hypothetical protein
MPVMGKSTNLILYVALIVLGLWGTYDWLVLDRPNKGIFITPIAIWLLWVEFLSPSRDRL